MFSARILTASCGFLLIILTCGCTYAPDDSARAGKTPASVQSGRSSAQGIADAAQLVKEQLESCGSVSTYHSRPVISGKETSWKLASASGCAWRFEYSGGSYGYSPQDSSSGWYGRSTCSAAVNLSQLALDSITAKPAQHLPNATEIYFTTFNQQPVIHVHCSQATNIQVQSGGKTLSDANSKDIDQDEADLDQWEGTGPFCTDHQGAGRIQQALSKAAGLCGAQQ